jgi:hypothetical protein
MLYGVFAPLMFFLSFDFSRHGEQHIARLCSSSAFWYAVIAVLCVVGMQMMSYRTREPLLVGALAVTAAFCIVTWTWIATLLQGNQPWPAFEPLLIWPPLLYAIIYAFRESESDHAAKPGAAPNDGPATPSGSSRVTERP